MRKYLALSLLLSLPLAAVAQSAAPAADAVKITPYGIITLDLYKNSGLFSASDYPNYATSTKEGAFVASARQSRFGVNVAVPAENLVGATLTGKVEFDFMASDVTTSWNGAHMRLRHAFVNAEWAGDAGKFFVLAGQTDALVNQLHPESTAYLANPMFQQAGNLHRRTPQLRLGYLFDSAAVAVKIEAELGSPADSTKGDYNTGNRSGTPDYEARLGLTLKPVSGFGGTVGVGYHTNSRAYDGAGYVAATHSPIETVTTSLIGLDLDLNLTQYLNLRGEYFSAKGTDDGFSGIATSSVVGAAGNRHGVETKGYWAQAVIKPVAALWLLAGVGQEKVDDATYLPAVAGDKDRLQNDMIHGGLLINMNKAWRVGLEYVQTTTKTRAATAADLTATAEVKASQVSLSTQLRF